MGNFTFETAKAQARLARIVGELAARPMTIGDLERLLGITTMAVRRYLTHLRAAPRRVFIKRWLPTGGLPAPIFAAGSRRDAPKPVTKTRQERNRQDWLRIKADPDRYDRVRAAARVHYRIHRLRGRPQPWFAALLDIRSAERRPSP